MDNPIKPEEEYQFSETESSNVFDPSVGRKRPGMPPGGLRNKNLLLVIGVVIAFFVIFKVVSMFTKSKKEIPATPAATSVQTGQNVANLNEGGAVNNRLSVLERVGADHNVRLQKLESAVTNAANVLSDIEMKLANINNSLQILANEVNQQQSQIAALQAAKVKPVAAKRAAGPRVTYHIQAMFPGRAWLTSPDGATITVREGTKLPSYGVVQAIDTDQGFIGTSSGRVIRYSTDDS